ncbi:MAG: anthranilate synthase component I family protein [Candidatus Hadarchaeum sp.]|uniref:anthranilate synthase component I family protein n=1 Tax=Candidatus Hadarchaeum sp. TaxID=2883567 RepID=UPI003D0A53D4
MIKKVFPNRRSFVKLSKNYSVIPVSIEVGVKFDPVLSLYSMRQPCFAFERDGKSIFGQAEEIVASDQGESPFSIISKLLEGNIAPSSLTGFSGGIVGYLGYDSARPELKMEWKEPDPVSLPYALFLRVSRFYETSRGKLKAVYCARVDDEPKKVYSRAIEEAESMLELPEPKPPKEPRFSEVSVNVKKAEYLKMVAEAKSCISRGEIRQAIISRRLSCRSSDPLSYFFKLRRLNPCPYIFYLQTGGRVILGSSPENFLTVHGNFAESRPVASTRRRGTNPVEDRKLEQELRNSPKERSEHAMLLGECVAEFKSVCSRVIVRERLRVKKFPFFQHLVSRITGKTEDKFNLLKATFPSATIAGVPKRRAMEVIDEIEPDARGVYAGSFGYVSNSGSLDMGIIVRSILINGGKAFVPVGAGIVSQSVPEAEYQETFFKSRAQLLALGADQDDMKWISEL